MRRSSFGDGDESEQPAWASVDLSPGRLAHAVAIDLDPLGSEPGVVWARIMAAMIGASTGATTGAAVEGGNVVVFVHLVRESVGSNAGQVLVASFVESIHSGGSVSSRAAIVRAMAEVHGRAMGPLPVPEEAVPVAVQVGALAMRIVVPAAGEWVRFALDRPEDEWVLVPDQFATSLGDPGHPEPGIDLVAAVIDDARVFARYLG